MTEERCGNCRFFQKDDSLNNHGYCRRYPEWVYKQNDEWCGEWTPDAMAVIERMGEEAR